MQANKFLIVPIGQLFVIYDDIVRLSVVNQSPIDQFLIAIVDRRSDEGLH